MDTKTNCVGAVIGKGFEKPTKTAPTTLIYSPPQALPLAAVCITLWLTPLHFATDRQFFPKPKLRLTVIDWRVSSLATQAEKPTCPATINQMPLKT